MDFGSIVKKHKVKGKKKREGRSSLSPLRTEQNHEISISEECAGQSVHKKKHKKHKINDAQYSMLLMQNDNPEDRTQTPKKKKKKRKPDDEQNERNSETFDDHAVPDTSMNDETPKKKKRHKSGHNEMLSNDSITLDMLQNESSVLVNELSVLRQSTATSQEASSVISRPSKISNNNRDKSVVNPNSVLAEKSGDSVDNDGRLQVKQIVNEQNTQKNDVSKKKKKKKRKTEEEKESTSKGAGETDITNADDPQIDMWLNSLENDVSEAELDFEPTELHKNFQSLRWMNAKEKEECSNTGVKFRLGKWSYKEDITLKQNLENFVQKYDVPSIPLILGINKNAKEKVNPKLVKYLHRKKFLLHLGRNIDVRPLYSIYQRARRLFHPMNKSKLSPEELSQVFRIQAKMGKKWNTISEIMQKPSKVLFEAVRYHTEKRDLGDWTTEENEKLFEAVKRKLRLREDGTCKQLPWKKIAKRVGSRNSQQCCKQWLHNLCWKFAHGEEMKPRWTDEDSLRLIQHLFTQEAETEADLDWNDIFTKFSKLAAVPGKKVSRKEKTPEMH